jgi:hypothetical protein
MHLSFNYSIYFIISKYLFISIYFNKFIYLFIQLVLEKSEKNESYNS